MTKTSVSDNVETYLEIVDSSLIPGSLEQKLIVRDEVIDLDTDDGSDGSEINIEFEIVMDKPEIELDKSNSDSESEITIQEINTEPEEINTEPEEIKTKKPNKRKIVNSDTSVNNESEAKDEEKKEIKKRKVKKKVEEELIEEYLESEEDELFENITNEKENELKDSIKKFVPYCKKCDMFFAVSISFWITKLKY